MARKPKKPIEVKTLRHEAAKRPNIPTAEFTAVYEIEAEFGRLLQRLASRAAAE